MKPLLIGSFWLFGLVGDASAAQPLSDERGFTQQPVAEGAFYFTDREKFLAETGATLATTPLPDSSTTGRPFVSGRIEFDTTEGSSFNFADWPADFPDDNDIEIALNGTENLDVRSITLASPSPLASQPVHAMGIEFAEPGGTDSTFVVRALTAAGREVALIAFRSPDNAPGFIGVWSPVPFSLLEIRESPTANENEYFGRVFTSPVRPPVEWRKLRIEGGSRGARFGSSVAVDGEFAVVGAPDVDQALVLQRRGYAWAEFAALSRPRSDSDFGSSVALRGDYAAVGAPLGEVDRIGRTGLVRVYQRQGDSSGDLVLVGELSASDATPDAGFGFAVAMAINGERILVADGRVPTRAYIFERRGLSWLEFDRFDAETTGDFGLGIDLEGDLALVGPQVFRRQEAPQRGVVGPEWVLEATLAAPVSATDGFGNAAALDGNRALIGAPFVASGSGAAYLFERTAPGDWRLSAELHGDGSDEQFGRAVALDGDQIVIGAPRADDNGFSSGAVYRFARSNDGWSRVGKMFPPDNAAGDLLGNTGGLDMDARTAFVGARQDDDYFEQSGALYLLELLLFSDGFEDPGLR